MLTSAIRSPLQCSAITCADSGFEGDNIIMLNISVFFSLLKCLCIGELAQQAINYYSS